MIASLRAAWRAVVEAIRPSGWAPVPPELAEAELPESVVRARSMVGTVGIFEQP